MPTFRAPRTARPWTARPWLALALLLVPLAAPALVVAQDEPENAVEGELPPLPRPRPEGRDPAPSGSTGGAEQAIEILTNAPQPVALSALIATGGEPIGAGLVWRVFDTTPDASGELTMVARSEEPMAEIELPPGEYVVHVAFGAAQTSDTITVVPGPNTKQIALEAGALRLHAQIEGELPIPPELLAFDIQTPGAEGSRVAIAENIRPDQIVTLNGGTYHVVSRFGSVNAVVRADLRVEAGQLTDATLFHNAGLVTLRLVSEEGGEAIADVEWTIQGPDGTPLFTETGAFPSLVLARGDYIVLARQGDTVYDRNFTVPAGAPIEIEVQTDAVSTGTS